MKIKHIYFFFFFQAEDGIRDYKVTGVQTCALPILQLLGDIERQQELMPKVIAFYHGYLRRPPVEWQFMPMMPEAAPNFARQFPDAVAIFDNLHMLHDNFDDILVRPDLFPTLEDKRAAILRILPIYLHRNHGAQDAYAEFHEKDVGGHG